MDHNPPHFHAEYQGHRAEYSIKTLDIISGKLLPRAYALVLEWASQYKNEFLNNWKKAAKPDSLSKRNPLN